MNAPEYPTTGPFTPFAQWHKDIPDDQRVDGLLEQAKEVLASLEGVSSCHEAVEKWLKVTGIGYGVRGHYYPSYEHSWIDMGSFILDIYPVGGCRPHLVAKQVAYHLYEPLIENYERIPL